MICGLEYQNTEEWSVCQVSFEVRTEEYMDLREERRYKSRQYVPRFLPENLLLHANGTNKTRSQYSVTPLDIQPFVGTD